MIYPWQQSQWQQFNDMQKNRIPHALLLLGKPGLGKKSFAEMMAKTLLCEQANDVACDHCHSCSLFQANTHPDFKSISPEESASMIKIDQIRDVTHFVYETAQQSKNRVVVIDPATRMNIQSMNALLKTLEEPAPHVVIILTAEQSLRLPATITSRCQKIIFHAPAEKVALAWSEDLTVEALELAEGAPLKALAMIKENQLTVKKELYQGLIDLAQDKADPLQLALKYQEMDLRFILDLLFIWVKGLLRAQLQAVHEFPFKKLKSSQLVEYSHYIQKIYEYVFASVNLNKQLLLEDLFIRWKQYVSG
ncbi:hypothetical protein AYO45_00065 [Gammaproteobacteria bacterium SCGC AG-212-F23]|nr:hypothetical protein AYO45_00065 [Gammaproteobacteria bacterium SCGC AG-212-F23]